MTFTEIMESLNENTRGLVDLLPTWNTKDQKRSQLEQIRENMILANYKTDDINAFVYALKVVNEI